jgi:hypothetical protein
LAELVGTTESAISRQEDAAYDGHSLTMLRRIAAVLNQRVEVRFVPDGKRPSPARFNASHQILILPPFTSPV